MLLSDFDYSLPPELIAYYPQDKRSDSRLLSVARNRADFGHHRFADLPALLRPGDLMVFNNTKVMAARLFAHKTSGGKVEIMVERLLGGARALAQVKASKAPRPGAELLIAEGISARVMGREDAFFLLEFSPADIESILQTHGHIPLPPYIERHDEEIDQDRYQTLYAERLGAVAAPTAGLHFDQEVLDALAERGVESAFITLHVGAGTYQPVRAEQVEQHKMHAEYAEVSAEVCERILATKARGGRVIAVGTTSVRSLESAAAQATGSGPVITPLRGETDIFIYPGFEFRCVDAMITNFHLPKSSLLMLVSAFIGREKILSAYEAAIAMRYRFFSYGDAMLLIGKEGSVKRGRSHFNS